MAKIQTVKNIAGETVYPKTVANAVMYDADNTMSALASNGLYLNTDSSDVDDIVEPVNATTLNGYESDYFASKGDLNTEKNILNDRIDDVNASIAEINRELSDIEAGPAGKSAYEYAKEGGYTGTEEQFAKDINPINIKADVTPKLNVDYFTENDKNIIISQVYDLIKNGGVVGFIDENNNIVLNGTLTDNAYFIKYRMDDGSTVDIGNLVFDNNVYYTVTNNLTNCTTTNNNSNAIEGQSYSSTVTANDGYTLSSIVVTMGGTDITSTVVDGDNISIASVTGNITITAVAIIEKTSGNLADPTSADWLTDTRLATGYGYGKANVGSILTNYIPVKRGDVLRVKGLNLFGVVDSQNSTIGCYRSINKTADSTGKYNDYDKLYVLTSITSGKSSEGVKEDVSVDGDIFTYTILMRDGAQFSTANAFNYIRISAPLAEGYTANDVIITVNEPIEEDNPDTPTTSYTNLLPLSVDANGNDYRGENGEDGYKAGYKMSTSSGNESATNGAYCSGFMPIASIDDVIRVKNVTLSGSANVNNFVFYNANKAKIYTNACIGAAGAFHINVDVENGCYQVHGRSYGAENPAFFRFSCGGITDNTIVTVNEEIV